MHCDLSGNVLFHDIEPPTVIDLSLYWRPVPYAEAVVAVDALLWYDAEPDVLDVVEHPYATQLLLRAAIFRLATEDTPNHVGQSTPIHEYERLADLTSYSDKSAAVARARQLIDARQYVLTSNWGEVAPTAEHDAIAA